MQKELWRMTFLEMKNKGLAQNRAEAYPLVISALEKLDNYLGVESACREASADFKALAHYRYKDFVTDYQLDKLANLYRKALGTNLRAVILISFFQKIQKVQSLSLLIDLHEVCHSDFDLIIEDRLLDILPEISEEELEILKNRKIHRDWQHVLSLALVVN